MLVQVVGVEHLWRAFSWRNHRAATSYHVARSRPHYINDVFVTSDSRFDDFMHETAII